MPRAHLFASHAFAGENENVSWKQRQRRLEHPAIAPPTVFKQGKKKRDLVIMKASGETLFSSGPRVQYPPARVIGREDIQVGEEIIRMEKGFWRQNRHRRLRKLRSAGS